jgi:hypothetical protein
LDQFLFDSDIGAVIRWRDMIVLSWRQFALRLPVTCVTRFLGYGDTYANHRVGLARNLTLSKCIHIAIHSSAYLFATTLLPFKTEFVEALAEEYDRQRDLPSFSHSPPPQQKASPLTMPLWCIFSHADTFTPAQRTAFAKDVTDYYVDKCLPAF